MAHLAEDVVVEAGDGVGAARQGEQVQVAAVRDRRGVVIAQTA